MHRCAVPALVLLLAPLSSLCAGEAVSFRNEVMAVLSRAGCNMGACHGNLNGKGGFKLSLRGQDPERDLAALTREQLGRRTDPENPEASLILQKATARLPHSPAVLIAGGPSSLAEVVRRALKRPASPLDAARAVALGLYEPPAAPGDAAGVGAAQ